MWLRTGSRGVIAAAVAGSIASLAPGAAAQAESGVASTADTPSTSALGSGAPSSGAPSPVFAVDLSRYSLSFAPVAFAAPPHAAPPAGALEFEVAPTAAFELPKFSLGDRAEAARGAGFAIKAIPSCTSDSCGDLAARLALRAGDDDWRLSVGARASLGDQLSSHGGEGGRSSWYMFVAADTQAMSFSFRPREESSSLQLEDLRLLGDAQAGVGKRVAGGDLAIGFVTREISHMGADRQENWVGLTYGWSG
jgi:hypothetical protein